MRSVASRLWWTVRASRDDDGQLMLLVLAYTLIAFALVAVAVDATAVHLARTQLLDAADAAALDAADALDDRAVYTKGLGGELRLRDDDVQAQARTYLSTYTTPSRVDALVLGPGTGSPDGASARVELSARVRLPVAAPLVASLRGPVTVTVRSTARADLEP